MTTLIQICSLEAAREANWHAFDGVITIEDSTIEDPLRVDGPCKQLVLKFDDISLPVEGYIQPEEHHIENALLFADQVGEGLLLIHCHAGISRSSAIALAIIAKALGAGKEIEAIKTLRRINPYAHPNKLMVWMADEILNRNMKLYKAASNMLCLTD